MLSRYARGPCGRETTKFRKGGAAVWQTDGNERRPRARTVPRCSSGPIDSGDIQGGEKPKRAPQHPEMDDSSPAASSGSPIPDTLPYTGSHSDWREFRAKLVSQSRGSGSGASPSASTPCSPGGGGTDVDAGTWAHVIPKPEKGCLLLAHPLLFQQSQTYFHRAAVLLLEHGDRGSYGVILNRPSKFLLREVPLNRPQTPFGECRLHIGGDVGAGEVQVLHPYGQLSGVQEVVRGVYLGGMDAAGEAVEAGVADVKNFRWFSSYAGWAPGQLAMEVKRGVWFTAAASPQLLLRGVEPGEGPAYWHQVMVMLGGDYEELSRAVQKHDDLADFSA